MLGKYARVCFLPTEYIYLKAKFRLLKHLAHFQDVSVRVVEVEVAYFFFLFQFSYWYVQFQEVLVRFFCVICLEYGISGSFGIRANGLICHP